MPNLGRIDLWGWIAPVLDVLVVAAVLYSLLMLARGTRAWKIFSGLAVFAGIYVLSDILQFRTLNWLLRQIVPLAPVALVILFFPELRYALEEVGRVRFWQNRLWMMQKEDAERLVHELVRVAETMASKSVGALMVLEREEGLDDLIATGTSLDARVTTELLQTLFHPGSALHDGAVIIRGDRVVAAGCVLPLTDRPDVGSDIHTRHRAAIGVSERSDALVIVVSEETGAISVCEDGRLMRGMKAEALKERLFTELKPPEEAESRFAFLQRRDNRRARAKGGKS